MYSDVRQGPLMRFATCGTRLASGTYLDVYGYEIVGVTCNLPSGHDGPCALVEYKEITYPNAIH